MTDNRPYGEGVFGGPGPAGRGQTREDRWAEAVFDANPHGESPPSYIAAALLALADSEQSDLRSRLAAAKVRAHEDARIQDELKFRAHALQTERDGSRAELARLRAGIQALADEWEAGSAYEQHYPASLRSLLSPANPQKDEQP